VPYFSITLPAPDDSADWGTLREVASAAEDLDAALLTSAVALQLWHSRHTHCPICGTPTVESQAGWIRVCPNDASEHFPRTDPAVIMVVHDGGDRCLLGRGQAWGEGRFSTLAGFVEPGESLEGAVAREVWEEVAVGVTDVRYVASQPWPFPSSLMVGFVARVDGDPTLQVDAVEVAEAGWFTREEVARAAARTDVAGPDEPGVVLQRISPKLSISRYLIDCWLSGEIGA
jgi:NAD+ diphosphatase